MAKQTPEGKVKQRLLKFLKEIGCWYYMPVQNGMGQSGIPDVVALIDGEFVGFECKATPKQHPTTLQARQLSAIDRNGGYAWVVDNESLDLAIDSIKHGLQYGMALDKFAKFIKQDGTCDIDKLQRWKKKLEVMEFQCDERTDYNL